MQITQSTLPDTPDGSMQDFLQILAWGFGIEGVALILKVSWLLGCTGIACCVLICWLRYQWQSGKSCLGNKAIPSPTAINRGWGIAAMILFITVFLFTIAPVAEFFSLDPLDNTISFECVSNSLPSIMPTSGVISELNFSPSDSLADSTPGFTAIKATPGAKLDWTNAPASYRCRMASNKETVAGLEIELPGFFSDGKNGDGSGVGHSPGKSGNYTAQNRVYIPVLNPHTAEPFEFYIFNKSVYGLSIPTPKTASLKQENSKTPRTIKLIHSTIAGLPLFLPPLKTVPNEQELSATHPTVMDTTAR